VNDPEQEFPICVKPKSRKKINPHCDVLRADLLEELRRRRDQYSTDRSDYADGAYIALDEVIDLIVSDNLSNSQDVES